jgi:hypothetical protein
MVSVNRISCSQLQQQLHSLHNILNAYKKRKMKKYLLSTIIALLFSVAIFAQSTSPRFGTASNGDNTGRVLTYAKTLLTDATGADSVILFPRYYTTYYDVTLLDSFTLKQPNVTQSYYGDKIILVVHAPSGTPKLKFTGSNWITAGTATLGAGLRAIIELDFDGANWVEASRVVQ